MLCLLIAVFFSFYGLFLEKKIKFTHNKLYLIFATNKSFSLLKIKILNSYINLSNLKFVDMSREYIGPCWKCADLEQITRLNLSEWQRLIKYGSLTEKNYACDLSMIWTNLNLWQRKPSNWRTPNLNQILQHY